MAKTYVTVYVQDDLIHQSIGPNKTLIRWFSTYLNYEVSSISYPRYLAMALGRVGSITSNVTKCTDKTY